MKRAITKTLIPWITIIIVFMFGFYLSSQRSEHDETQVASVQNNSSENQFGDKDYSVKQKLINDFEIAFLKQYTPLVGCEELNSEVKTAACSQHLEQAKYGFQQQFIKSRGLPNDTFEELKLSFAD